MSVRVKVFQMEMPIVGKTLRLSTCYGEADSDRSIGEFFTLFLPFLSAKITEFIVFPCDGICQRKIVINIDYGDKDISDVRNEVEK